MSQAYHQPSIGTTENQGASTLGRGSREVRFSCMWALQQHCSGSFSFSFHLDTESPRRHTAAASVRSLMERFNKARLIFSTGVAPSPGLASWTELQRKELSELEQLSPFASCSVT